METVDFKTLESEDPASLDARCLRCKKSLRESFALYKRRLEKEAGRSAKEKRELVSSAPSEYQSAVRFAQQADEAALRDPEGHFHVHRLVCPSCDVTLYACGRCLLGEAGTCIACEKRFELCPSCRHANPAKYERCAGCGRSKAMAEAISGMGLGFGGGIAMALLGLLLAKLAGLGGAIVVLGIPALGGIGLGLYSAVKAITLHFSEMAQEPRGESDSADRDQASDRGPPEEPQ